MHSCQSTVLAQEGPLSVRRSDCGVFQVVVGHTIVRLDAVAFRTLANLLTDALVLTSLHPPRQHDEAPTTSAPANPLDDDLAIDMPGAARAHRVGEAPTPHDPSERVVVADTGDWQLRAFAPGDPKATYFAESGFSHVQFWNPSAGISVLTPSALTCGRWQVFPIDGWKRDFVALATAREAIIREHRIELPDDEVVHALVAGALGTQSWTPWPERNDTPH